MTNQPPNEVLHADGARLGGTTLVLTLGDRPLGAGAAGEHQAVVPTRTWNVRTRDPNEGC